MESPPAMSTPSTAVAISDAPPAEPWSGVSFISILLQISHRLGTVGLLALLGTLACAATGRAFHVYLAAAAGSVLVGGCAAVLALTESPRFGAIILLGTIGAAAAAVLLTDAHAGLATGVAAADLLLCSAVFAWTVDDAHHAFRREATGVLAFNAGILVVSVVLMLIARAGVIQDTIRQEGGVVRGQVQDFFTPPPALPPQQ
jgi:hypothetical protein